MTMSAAWEFPTWLGVAAALLLLVVAMLLVCDAFWGHG